jgi:putative IMPACT (imprinted ancient) family translation regulator
LLPYIEMVSLNFTLDYEQFQPFEYALKKVSGEIIAQDFAAQIRVTVKLPAENVAQLQTQFHSCY